MVAQQGLPHGNTWDISGPALFILSLPEPPNMYLPTGAQPHAFVTPSMCMGHAAEEGHKSMFHTILIGVGV